MAALLKSRPIRMLNKLQEALSGEYEALPESVKQIYTPQQWLWLSDADKGNLMRNETEPESFDE